MISRVRIRWIWYKLLGCMFGYSGTFKLLHLSTTLDSLIPVFGDTGVRYIIAFCVIAVELVLALRLIVQPPSKSNALIVILLLSAFTIYLLVLTQHGGSDCGCGDLITFWKNTRHAALFGIVRNCALIVVHVIINALTQGSGTKPLSHVD